MLYRDDGYTVKKYAEHLDIGWVFWIFLTVCTHGDGRAMNECIRGNTATMVQTAFTSIASQGRV